MECGKGKASVVDLLERVYGEGLRPVESICIFRLEGFTVLNFLYFRFHLYIWKGVVKSIQQIIYWSICIIITTTTTSIIIIIIIIDTSFLD